MSIERGSAIVLCRLSFPQGLADYYDKCPPEGMEEQKDAVNTYQRLLQFVEK